MCDDAHVASHRFLRGFGVLHPETPACSLFVLIVVRKCT